MPGRPGEDSGPRGGLGTRGRGPETWASRGRPQPLPCPGVTAGVSCWSGIVPCLAFPVTADSRVTDADGILLLPAKRLHLSPPPGYRCHSQARWGLIRSCSCLAASPWPRGALWERGTAGFLRRDAGPATSSPPTSPVPSSEPHLLPTQAISKPVAEPLWIWVPGHPGSFLTRSAVSAAGPPSGAGPSAGPRARISATRITRTGLPRRRARPRGARDGRRRVRKRGGVARARVVREGGAHARDRGRPAGVQRSPPQPAGPAGGRSRVRGSTCRACAPVAGVGRVVPAASPRWGGRVRGSRSRGAGERWNPPQGSPRFGGICASEKTDTPTPASTWTPG